MTEVYLLNVITKVLHKVYRDEAGQHYSQEQCNTDQIPFQRRKIFEEPVESFVSHSGRTWPVKKCQRCFPNGTRG